MDQRIDKEDDELEVWKKLNENEEIHSWLFRHGPGWTEIEAQGIIIAIVTGMVALLAFSIYFVFA